MIQTIGLMVGFYILFRVIETTISKPQGWQRITNLIFGSLLALVTIV